MDISVFSKYISEQKRVYPAVEGRITVRNSSSSTVHSLGLLLLLALYLPLSLALWSSAKTDELKPPPEYGLMPTPSYLDDRPVLQLSVFLKIKHKLKLFLYSFLLQHDTEVAWSQLNLQQIQCKYLIHWINPHAAVVYMYTLYKDGTNRQKQTC